MALLFDSTSELVNCGSNSSLDHITELTTCAWVWRNSSGLDRRIWQKAYWGGDSTYHVFEVADYPAANYMRLVYYRGSSDMKVTADVVNFSAYGLNKWMFWAGVHDSVTSANNKLWIGDLDSLADEPASYYEQTAGSGTWSPDSSADLTLGNRINGGCVWTGKIALVGIWNTKLTEAQIHQQQFRLHSPVAPGNCMLWMHLGLQGLGRQTDWSGKSNHGTITGATLAQRLPKHLFRKPALPQMPAFRNSKYRPPKRIPGRMIGGF